MEKLTFKNLAKKVLEEERRPLSAEEIWEIAKEKNYDKDLNSQGKTPWRSIGAQIYVDIKTNPNSPFIKLGSKPVRFFLKNLSTSNDMEELEIDVKEDRPKKSFFKERDLHKVLTYYAFTYMNIYVKTIYHEKSSKKRFSQWLFPDLVGVYFPESWEEEVIDLAKELGSSPIILYSFEVKRELGFHNLREAFFQAVSNSSWANEGYLVSANISKNDEFMSEIRRLSTAFGIGLIQLDIENPDNSEIIFPARQKSELDWDTVNKLALENRDFKNFLKRIKNDLTSKEIRKEQYDKVYSSEEIVNYFNKLKNKN